MSPKELKSILLVAMANGKPVLIKGAPGVGKSDIVSQVAAELEMELIISHPVVSDPTDFKGLPGLVDGKAEFLPYGDLRQMMEAKKPTIVFLDDLGQAPAVVQAACMQLLLARQINGKKISDKIVFVAATNRREDRAGVTGILEPVKSRFKTIINLEVNSDEWIEWAFANNMPPELIGFINWRPALLSAGEATHDIVNHPCPRTIANAGEWMKLGITDMETISGAIGEGAAVELLGFIKVYKSLPNITAIILDPKKATVPEDPAALYAVTAALTDRAKEDNCAAIITYSNRLPADFSTLLIRDMIRKEPKIQNTPEFIDWSIKHKDSF